jgi:threonine dehydrogenase-like Zn-dependent dehydrogenase
VASMVSFLEPRVAEVVAEEQRPIGPGEVRLRTLYTGISAGTELTAYRGTNPYLNRFWDSDSRLFRTGDSSLSFPVNAWGYEEVGVVVETGADSDGIAVGDISYGTWGHRTHTVQPAEKVRRKLLPAGTDPRLGIFSQIGAIGLNLVLDADLHIGETVVIFGAGVPGQIAAQLARLNGGRVIIVDKIADRRARALELGADVALDPADGPVAERVRELTDGRGADVCLEVSGHYGALHEAIRTVAYNARVCVAGFMQGEGAGLRLGEEFHHNRVSLVCSQISGVAPSLQGRWDFDRLSRTAIELGIAGRLKLTELITHTWAFDRAAEAFRLLDEHPEQALQVILEVDDTLEHA